MPLIDALLRFLRFITYRSGERSFSPYYRQGMTVLKNRRPDMIDPNSPL